MIEEITIKFGTELKPTQNSCKLQLYNSKSRNRDRFVRLDSPKITNENVKMDKWKRTER